MTVVAEFTIRSEEFILGRVLTEAGATDVEIERVVPATRRIMPYIWVSVDDRDAFERSLTDSPTVEDVVHLDQVDERSLYRVNWDESVESLIYGIAEAGATILETTGGGVWTFRIRYPTHEDLSTFNDYCTEHDINFQLTRVYSLATDENAGQDVLGLTEQQREGLTQAVERGYFKVPRETTLEQIADELGISQQAASERIRRGVDKVLSNVLVERARN